MGRKSPLPGICEYWCSVVRFCALVRTEFRRDGWRLPWRRDGWRLPWRYERSACGRGADPVRRPARADLTGYLGRDALIGVWPELHLPKGVRQA